MSHPQRVDQTPAQVPATATDPVCGMTVDRHQAAGSSTHQGIAYHFCSTHCQKKFQANPQQFVKQQAATAVDPVCGMTVDPVRSAGSHTHAVTTYHFCSRNCLAKFKDDPERFLNQSQITEAKHEPHAAPGKYTCPMHPEVV
jgi:Cu+-exporting ATPase